MQVTIVMPVFNTQQSLLAEAVASVIAQRTQAPWELLIVDDYSNSAETLRALEQIQRSDERIRVLRNTQAKGLSSARRFGVENAKGDWIAFLDSDDIWEVPDGLAKRLAVVDAHPDAEWIVGSYDIIEEDGTISESLLRTVPLFAPAFDDQQLVILDTPAPKLVGNAALNTGATLVTKELFEQVGAVPPGLVQAEDWYLWMLLGLESRLFFIPDIVVHYRRHPAAVGRDPRALLKSGTLALRLAHKDKRLRPLRKQIRWKLASEYRSLGRLASRLEFYWRSLGYDVMAWRWVPTDSGQIFLIARRFRDAVRSVISSFG